MRIIGLDEFLAMPSGTLFAKYDPMAFGSLQIKGDNDFTHPDFSAKELLWVDCDSTGDMVDKLMAGEKGAPVKLDFDAYGRDGMFDRKQLFAVLEKDDIYGMITTLIGSYEAAGGERTDLD